MSWVVFSFTRLFTFPSYVVVGWFRLFKVLEKMNLRSSRSFMRFGLFTVFQIVFVFVPGCLGLSQVQVVKTIQAASIFQLVTVVLVCLMF